MKEFLNFMQGSKGADTGQEANHSRESRHPCRGPPCLMGFHGIGRSDVFLTPQIS